MTEEQLTALLQRLRNIEEYITWVFKLDRDSIRFQPDERIASMDIKPVFFNGKWWVNQARLDAEITCYKQLWGRDV